MSTLAIEMHGVEKRFGEGELATWALRGIDLSVARGELLILAGPSGSGKTTLLSILGCLLAPTKGRVRIFGEEVSALRERELPAVRLARIGFVFQGHNLIASLSACDNVALPLRMRGLGARSARREAEALLARVGLADRAGALPSELSGGQRQRVAVARALAGDPPLILADEPTASLDAETGRSVSEILRTLCAERGATCIVVTHDERIFHLADRLVHIEDGRIADDRIVAREEAS